MPKGDYLNPPIEEAMVEFRFAPSQDWDFTMPGKIHQHPTIKDEYNGKPRTQKVVEAALKAEPGNPPNIAVREGISRFQLINQDGNRILSLGTDVLSVNVLRPYEGWSKFKPRIERALAVYQEIASPIGVMRIGVRYINKVVIPEKGFDLAKYFRCGPPITPELPDQLAGFLSRAEYLFDETTRLLLTQASAEAPESHSAVLLDLDVIRDWEAPESIANIMSSVEELHKKEGDAFEAIITDEARKVFDAS